MHIFFYKPKKKYGYLSNFSPHGFFLNDKKWKTLEHYFQASKYEHIPEYYEKIQFCNTPFEAAMLGRNKKIPLCYNWEKEKENVMRRGLDAKFRTHEGIKTLLIQTGDDVLIEDSPLDNYWGIGQAKMGKNRLGILLMELRKELQEEQWMKEANFENL